MFPNVLLVCFENGQTLVCISYQVIYFGQKYIRMYLMYTSEIMEGNVQFYDKIGNSKSEVALYLLYGDPGLLDL